jgi:hypothetical protein
MPRTFFAFGFLLLSVGPGLAEPRACVAGDPARGVAYLSDDPPKVFVRKVDLDDKATNRTYSVRTYSETEASGQHRDNPCGRQLGCRRRALARRGALLSSRLDGK